MGTLLVERQQIVESTRALREKREALLLQLQPLEKQLREIDKQIISLERPRLGQIDNELGTLAKACGGKSMIGG